MTCSTRADKITAAVDDMKSLAARRRKTVRELLQAPDHEVRTVLSRASEAGATHAIERLASAQ